MARKVVVIERLVLKGVGSSDLIGLMSNVLFEALVIRVSGVIRDALCSDGAGLMLNVSLESLESVATMEGLRGICNAPCSVSLFRAFLK